MTSPFLADEAIGSRLTLQDIANRPTITVPEAGAVLGLGRDAAYAAAHRGEIPTLKFAHRLVVPVPRLLQMLGAQPPEYNEAGAATAPDLANVRVLTQGTGDRQHAPAAAP